MRSLDAKKNTIFTLFWVNNTKNMNVWEALSPFTINGRKMLLLVIKTKLT